MFFLPLLPLTVLVISSFFTSALSAATGMGGGLLLFSIMAIYFPMNVLIPLHGIVQFFNNLFIVVFLKPYLRRDFILPFFFGSLIGVGAGFFLVGRIIQTQAPSLIIIALIAYTLFRPKKLPSLDVKAKNFFWVGIITAFLGLIAGAIDPVLAPFFIRKDMNKEEIIANKAFMQAIVHFSKIPLFYFLGFDYLPYLGLSVLINVACIFGTKSGIILLKKMNETVFIAVFKGALVVAGLRMVYKVLV